MSQKTESPKYLGYTMTATTATAEHLVLLDNRDYHIIRASYHDIIKYPLAFLSHNDVMTFLRHENHKSGIDINVNHLLVLKLPDAVTVAKQMDVYNPLDFMGVNLVALRWQSIAQKEPPQV